MAGEDVSQAWIRGSGGAEGPYFPSRIANGTTRTRINKNPLRQAFDSSWSVRSNTFFTPGRVFAVTWSETAGDTASIANSSNSSVSEVRYAGHFVYTNVRRFVVVQKNHEFCYGCPINTYGGRATTKRGVRPEEHGIIYNCGSSPRLVQGEVGITKAPVAVVASGSDSSLDIASRIYYGIHYPVQYNVKVRDLGYIAANDLPNLLGNWMEEHGGQARLIPDSSLRSPTLLEQQMWLPTPAHSNLGAVEIPRTDSPFAPIPTSTSRFEFVTDPRAFFKKGRVFMTLWVEPKGFSEAERGASSLLEQSFVETTRFAVVKAKATHCVCLRISTYSGQATTKAGVAVVDHAAVLPKDGRFQAHPKGEPQLTKDPIFVKIENQDVTIDPMSRINFAKPYTVEYNIKIRKIGRVFGDSVAKMEEYFAESLGLTRLE